MVSSPCSRLSRKWRKKLPSLCQPPAFRRRLHPRLVGAAPEIDDEGVRPFGRVDGGEVLRLDLHDLVIDAILAAGHVAERTPGAG
jgi:hypothetical protein